MVLFLGVHKLKSDMQDADVAKGFGDYKAKAMATGLHPVGAIYSLEKGFAYCQTEADSAELVRKAHTDAGIPLEDVIEVKTLS